MLDQVGLGAAQQYGATTDEVDARRHGAASYGKSCNSCKWFRHVASVEEKLNAIGGADARVQLLRGGTRVFGTD